LHLKLIRHGQASFGTDHYDRLTPLGIEQSRCLGAHLARTGHTSGTVYSGRMQRQRNTAELAAEELGSPECPGVVELANFDEYDISALFNAYLETVAANNPAVPVEREPLNHDPRLLRLAFEGVMDCWLQDTAPGVPGIEPWRAFRDRVHGGLEAMLRQHRDDGTAIVVTSSGVIATAVGIILDLRPRASINLGWQICNASVTELRYAFGHWSLTGFNSIDHLLLKDRHRLVTHR